MKFNILQWLLFFRKSIYYTQSTTFMSWLALIIIAISLSLILGAIFWDVPSTDMQLNLNDRQGYHYSVMCIAFWPVILYLTVLEVRKNRKTVQRDIIDGLYSKSTYIITKVSTKNRRKICRMEINGISRFCKFCFLLGLR